MYAYMWGCIHTQPISEICWTRIVNMYIHTDVQVSLCVNLFACMCANMCGCNAGVTTHSPFQRSVGYTWYVYIHIYSNACMHVCVTVHIHSPFQRSVGHTWPARPRTSFRISRQFWNFRVSSNRLWMNKSRIRAKKGQLLENCFHNSSIEIQPCDHDRVRGIYNSFTTQQTGNHVARSLGCKDTGWQRPRWKRWLQRYRVAETHRKAFEQVSCIKWATQCRNLWKLTDSIKNTLQRPATHCNALLHRFLRNADRRELRTQFWHSQPCTFARSLQ